MKRWTVVRGTVGMGSRPRLVPRRLQGIGWRHIDREDQLMTLNMRRLGTTELEITALQLSGRGGVVRDEEQMAAPPSGERLIEASPVDPPPASE
jgi:hypothetical protein